MPETCGRGHLLADTGYQRKDRPGLRCRACETANRRLRRRSAGMQPKPLTPEQEKAKADADQYLADQFLTRQRQLERHALNTRGDIVTGGEDFEGAESDEIERKPRPWDPGTLVQPGGQT
jgi:hypothetical protein